MIGQTISHYKILEKLGEGGMGVVYKAEDTKLDRPVALKFLPNHLLASEQDKARFVQEAKSASALNHPNVATVYEIDEVDGQMFIAMEFVDGVTLREKMNSVSLKQAIDIGIQLADGLAAAHEKGVVHRDIKPENIMVRKDGICQIMDFGLAKLRGTKSKISRLTKEGSTIGTVGYMSPEQVQGQDVDHRSDIFSLGVVLYELFTGQLPFKGVHETALLYEIVNVDPPPMSAVKPEIDPMLDGIVLECLVKEPGERYQSIAEVAKELRRIKRESTRTRATRTMATRQFQKSTEPSEGFQPVEGSRRRLLFPILTALLAIAVIVLLLKPKGNENQANRPVMRFSIELPPNAPIGGLPPSLDISPDGKYFVYSSQITGPSRLYLRRMDQMEAQVIPGTEGASYSFFSPDGQWIAFQVGDKLKKVSVFGGAAEDICNTDGVLRGGWWGPDNMIFYGHISKSIMRVSAQGGTPEAVTKFDSAAGEISHRFPQLLSDGKTLIFTIKPNNIATFDDAIIAVQRIGTNDRKILVHGGCYARYIPTGHLVYVRGNSLFAVPFDAEHLEIKGPPQQLFNGGWFNPFSGDATFSFSNSGVLAYVPLGSTSFDVNTVALMDLHGKLEPLLETPRPYFNATFSPDGQKLAITINAANDDIWVYHRGRKMLTRLTFGGGNNGFPIWTPDGKFVIYGAERGKPGNLYKKSWDGSGAEEKLTQSDQSQYPTSMTPDGKNLSFIQAGDVWILPFDGAQKPFPFIQSPSDESSAMFSPDGRWLAYSSNESDRYEIFVTSFPGHESKWQISSGGGSNPVWSRDGKKLFYVSGTTLMAVDVSLRPTFDYSSPKKVCDVPASTSGPWDISPDGKQFVMIVSPTQQTTSTKVDVVLEWFDELKEKFNGKNN